MRPMFCSMLMANTALVRAAFGLMMDVANMVLKKSAFGLAIGLMEAANTVL